MFHRSLSPCSLLSRCSSSLSFLSLSVFRSFSSVPSSFSTPLDPRSVSFSARRLVSCRPEEMFAAVLYVSEYETFLPFCLRSRIIHPSSYPAPTQLTYLSAIPNKPIEFEAELTIGFQIFTERYISHVKAHPHSYIRACSLNSQLFKSLNSEWSFQPTSNGACQVEFRIDFAVNSSIHATAVKFFFTEVAERQMKAFIERALKIKRMEDKNNEKTVRNRENQEKKTIPLTSIIQLRFSSAELTRLSSLFSCNSSAGLMSLTNFLSACRPLSEPTISLFPRYRSRATLKSMIEEPKVARQILERDFPSSSPIQLNQTQFYTQIFFLCKASPEAKFERAMNRIARSVDPSSDVDSFLELDFEWDSNQLLPWEVLNSGTLQFFSVELAVLRQLVPGMIVRSLKSSQGNQGSDVERGLDALALVGLIESALEETERAVHDACNQLRQDQKQISLRDWKLHFLERHAELLSLSSVLGMSRLIGWAIECRNLKAKNIGNTSGKYPATALNP
jgi:coenzyme Q-binding protein COQ10